MQANQAMNMSSSLFFQQHDNCSKIRATAVLRKEVHLGLKIYLSEKCATRRSFRGFLFSPNSLVFGWLVGWLVVRRSPLAVVPLPSCQGKTDGRTMMMMMLDRYFSAAFSTPPSPTYFQVEVEMVNQQARLPLRCHDEMERIFPAWDKGREKHDEIPTQTSIIWSNSTTH